MGKIIFLALLLFCIQLKPNDTEKNQIIPSQTEILSVQWDGKELVVDVSKEISSYGGGNAMEYEVVSYILEQAFSIPEVESFTLLIEGREEYLPEGTLILNYSRDEYENNYFRNTK